MTDDAADEIDVRSAEIIEGINLARSLAEQAIEADHGYRPRVPFWVWRDLTRHLIRTGWSASDLTRAIKTAKELVK